MFFSKCLILTLLFLKNENPNRGNILSNDNNSLRSDFYINNKKIRVYFINISDYIIGSIPKP